MLVGESKRKEHVDFPLLLANDNLHRVICACAFETILFIHNITVISFERMLQICEVNCFDF